MEINMARIKNSKLTAVRVPVRLANGRPSTGLRFKNLVPAERNLPGSPSAGPRPAEASPAATAPAYGRRLRQSIIGLRARAEAYGYDEAGFDYYRVDKNGLDVDGFDADGIHTTTGTAFAPERYGYAPGLAGNLMRGRDVHGFDNSGFDLSHYDASGNFDPNFIAEIMSADNPASEEYLWEARGKIRATDLDFYDEAGYSPATGRDRQGFNRQGLDAAGCNEDGYNSDGYDAAGYDRDNQENPDALFNIESGLNRHGFDVDGRNVFSGRRTARIDSSFDVSGPDGFDRSGVVAEGFNRGYDRGGWRDHHNQYGYDTQGVYYEADDPNHYDDRDY